MEYSDDNRGTFQTKRCAKQLLSFEGMRYGSITPTDLDGIIEYRNEAYILFEVKYRHSTLPDGQRLALQRMTDDFAKAGKTAVLLICEHEIDDVKQDILAKFARVRQVYFDGQWWPNFGTYSDRTVGDTVERFLRFVEKKRKDAGESS